MRLTASPTIISRISTTPPNSGPDGADYSARLCHPDHDIVYSTCYLTVPTTPDEGRGGGGSELCSGGEGSGGMKTPQSLTTLRRSPGGLELATIGLSAVRLEYLLINTTYTADIYRYLSLYKLTTNDSVREIHGFTKRRSYLCVRLVLRVAEGLPFICSLGVSCANPANASPRHRACPLVTPWLHCLCLSLTPLRTEASCHLSLRSLSTLHLSPASRIRATRIASSYGYCSRHPQLRLPCPRPPCVLAPDCCFSGVFQGRNRPVGSGVQASRMSRKIRFTSKYLVLTLFPLSVLLS
ncbi:hypothetical protein FGIG_00184 [Fasciola gigantica]|uniref:Uncharacterized protein n=1 Tax=Fasciola gigantica TaxID=46835 RepID=A0A504YNH2_FASGI|nr:hypothetical protein FGIG_00184 [Fasciola gigantica]